MRAAERSAALFFFDSPTTGTVFVVLFVVYSSFRKGLHTHDRCVIIYSIIKLRSAAPDSFPVREISDHCS